MAALSRPRVTINVAMTADGKISSARREPGRLTTELDLRHLDLCRAEADAVLVGAETVRRIDPPLHIRHADAQALRSGRAPPAQIVVSATGNVAPTCRALSQPTNARRILATTAGGAARFGKPPGGGEVWQLGDDVVDLVGMMSRLDEIGIERIVCEGGGRLNAALLQARLVDEYFVTVAPSLLGGVGAPTPMDGDGLAMPDRQRLTLTAVERVDDELYLRYRVVP